MMTIHTFSFVNEHAEHMYLRRPRRNERALMRLAPRRKEVLQQGAGFSFGDATVNFGFVVAGR